MKKKNIEQEELDKVIKSPAPTNGNHTRSNSQNPTDVFSDNYYTEKTKFDSSSNVYKQR